jgi:hypothetical protein
MTHPHQLGFGFDQMLEDQRTAHIPSTMDEAIPYYRKLIERHHEAMMAADVEKSIAIRGEARDLAVKLNAGKLLGICGGPDAPACVLERETAAPPGTVPMWGQEGSFTIDFRSIPVRIEQDGMFGIGASSGNFLGFGAHAVDYDRPFISETGYRSFLGLHGDVPAGMTPDMIAGEAVKAYVDRECKGKLRKIDRNYVEREMARRAQKDTQQQEPDL